MEKNELEQPSPEKNGAKRRKTIIIIEILLLVGTVIFILTYKGKENITSIDFSIPTPMMSVPKEKAEEPSEATKQSSASKEEKEKTKEVITLTPPEKKDDEKATPKEEPAKKADGKGYYLQIGVFSVKENYDEMEASVNKLGYPINLKMSKSKAKEGETAVDLYLLRVGPYPSKETALSIKEELKQKGIETYLFDK